MNLHEEIARTAYEIYEKSGRIDGRDVENWLEAERVVKTRSSQKEKAGEAGGAGGARRPGIVQSVKKILSTPEKTAARKAQPKV